MAWAINYSQKINMDMSIYSYFDLNQTMLVEVTHGLWRTHEDCVSEPTSID